MVILSKFINKNDTILDIGCGYCGYNKLIKTIHPDVKITNLTVSTEAYNYCKKQGYKQLI